MKLKISDVSKFKIELFEYIISDWEKEVEAQWGRLDVTHLKGALDELKRLKAYEIPPQQDEKINFFTLFALTVTELNKSKTTTYFVLPIHDIPAGYGKIKFKENSISITNKKSPFFGCKLNYRKEVEGREGWSDPRDGEYPATNDILYKVSHVYK